MGYAEYLASYLEHMEDSGITLIDAVASDIITVLTSVPIDIIMLNEDLDKLDTTNIETVAANLREIHADIEARVKIVFEILAAAREYQRLRG